MHAYHNHALSGGLLASRPIMVRSGKNSGGETSVIDARTFKRVKDAKQPIPSKTANRTRVSPTTIYMDIG